MSFDIQKAADLLLKRLETWAEALITHLPNVVVAIFILVFSYFLSRAMRNVAARFFRHVIESPAVQSLLLKMLGFTIIAVGTFAALGVLDLDKTVTSLLAGAGVVGIVIGFAFQEIASNFFSGILIAITKPYQLGDMVEVKDFLGRVREINLRTTNIETLQGLEVLIPNKYMFTEPLMNLTSTPDRRIDIKVGVSYGESLERVRQIALDALENVVGRLKNHPIEIFFKEFGDSSINFEAQIWIEYPGKDNFYRSRHEAIMFIKKAFDENGITIPFPIRTLDFGIKGGQKLFDSKVKIESVRSVEDVAQQNTREESK